MCKNLKSNESETSQLRIFMDNLINKYKISKDSSLYFPQVAYLKLDLIEEIFIRLKTFFKRQYQQKPPEAGIWGVGRSSRDQFFRIPHTK
jgi:hypothetical protein